MVAEILVLLAAIAGTAGLLGAFGWLWLRVRELEGRVGARTGAPGLAPSGRAPSGEDAEGLEQADLPEAVARLNERVDFLERLLEGDRERGPEHGRLPASAGPPDDPPADPPRP